MREAEVYRNDILAGVLTQEDRHSYVFRYDDLYFTNNDQEAISLTLPKDKQEYRSEYLFSFFFSMLSEGVNRQLQCRQLKIDETDYFGLLLATTQADTIGAITLKPVSEI